tara:strand:+ start:306 stop:1157 length:852 start_codon:yes stop_codon:yes gene_type:complete
MSGSSAIASARRRRTAPNEPIQTNNREQTQVQNNNNTGENNLINERITPLELLRQHEEKINNIENIINSKIELNKNIEERDSNLEKNININNKIQEIIKHEISNNILESNKEINILKENIDKLTLEIDTLKMLLIKNQTLSLETNTEIIKIKDLQNKQEEKIETQNIKIDNINNINNVNNVDTQTRNIFEQLLMGELPNMSNHNLELDEESEENLNQENNKLIIDNKISDDNLDVTDILTDNNEISINTIKDEVVNEVHKISEELIENVESLETAEIVENKNM